MDARGKDGQSLRDHLQSVYRQSGGAICPPELDVEPLPYHLEYIWSWFQELHAARGGSGFGANPISYSELYSWSEMTKTFPDPWEVDLIKTIDVLFLASTIESKTK